VARKIRVHCPISQGTFAELLKGKLAAIENDPIAAKILAVIRARNPLGDFDLYQGVFEVSVGIEGFTATDRARPAAGERGAATLSPTAIITTYVDAAANGAAVSAALDELVRAHPWETPVIEIADGTVRLPVAALTPLP
jgi:hypothetical protein